MKKEYLILVLIMLGFMSHAQAIAPLVTGQNPNYKIAMNKVINNNNKYILQQGTTVQQTYKAIDPLEEKRELRSRKKQYRSQRAYWRHQRKLKRIENTQYYDYGYYDRSYYRNTWLSLGLWGACTVW
ncbi:hypothetical protein [Aquimarina algiphila]|uniref:hypothetical protein n=1 Tax=Aquimarina algiphila TaxID=2047982 RepID=UPI0024915F69|nr:hypothetical protein [Aquimarina algiphila]